MIIDEFTVIHESGWIGINNIELELIDIKLDKFNAIFTLKAINEIEPHEMIDVKDNDLLLYNGKIFIYNLKKQNFDKNNCIKATYFPVCTENQYDKIQKLNGKKFTINNNYYMRPKQEFINLFKN